jgi:hypothetical protein
MNLALLLATAAATAVGTAALHATHGLRRQVTALRDELSASQRATGAALVPAARPAPAAETTAPPGRDQLAVIRAAVADALAEEREQELAEARAFWAAQETRDSADAPSLMGGPAGPGEETALFLPRQSDLVGLEAVLGPDGLVDPAEETTGRDRSNRAGAADRDESAELEAARRRHPSHPDFTPMSAAADHERTVTRLEELAATRTPLADVRPGPLGTLDVYVFADGTTVCMTPGDRETAERLATALRDGDAPVLLGGSALAGAYALTFGYAEESLYVLADRVIASL